MGSGDWMGDQWSRRLSIAHHAKEHMKPKALYEEKLKLNIYLNLFR